MVCGVGVLDIGKELVMTQLTEYDIKILRECNGENVPGIMWGAAMSVTISYLRGIGFLTIGNVPSNKGLEYLKGLDDENICNN